MKLSLRSITLTLTLVITLLILPTSQAQTNSLNDGLILYFSFDNNDATDSSGTGNNGTLTDITFVPGARSNSARFNGSTSYISVPNAENLDLSNEFTISGWARVQNVAYPFSYITILTRGNTSDFASAPYAIVYRIGRSSNIVPHARFYPNTGSAYVADLSINNALAFNRWSFFTWRFTSEILTIYKDGVKVGEQDLNIPMLLANDFPLEIGRDVPGVTEFFRGELDEIRIYNRSLSEEEIRQLYSEGSVYFLNLPALRK